MGLIGWIVFFVSYIPLTVGVYHLAKRYGRGEIEWTIGSLFLSPIVSIIVLWCLGETKMQWQERIINEEIQRLRAKTLNSEKESDASGEETAELSKRWQEQELCRYCGAGNLHLGSRRCKTCGRVN